MCVCVPPFRHPLVTGPLALQWCFSQWPPNPIITATRHVGVAKPSAAVLPLPLCFLDRCVLPSRDSWLGSGQYRDSGFNLMHAGKVGTSPASSAYYPIPTVCPSGYGAPPTRPRHAILPSRVARRVGALQVTGCFTDLRRVSPSQHRLHNLPQLTFYKTDSSHPVSYLYPHRRHRPAAPRTPSQYPAQLPAFRCWFELPSSLGGVAMAPSMNANH